MNERRRDMAAHVGLGWGFPVALETAKGCTGFTRAACEESVEQSIWIILNTSKGERVMRPEFGCGLHELSLAPNTPATRGLAESEVREALRIWEPRIEVIDVSAEPAGPHHEVIDILISYRIRATDSRFNMVYPLYLERSTP